MFKEYTYEYLLSKMLQNISDDIDKREGSVIYNAIAPCALELSNYYRKLESVVNTAFIDTSSGIYLDNLTKQFGISRKEATYAIKKGCFYDKENNLMDIELGKRFSIDGVIYNAYEKISIGVYQMKCEEIGSVGNTKYGNLIPIDYVKDLAIAEISDLLIPAIDTETDEELRDRFYNSIDNFAFGGNIADYKEKVKQIDGVGAVKVIPTWNGGGTVKLIILDSNYNAATDTLINNVQEVVGSNGDGIAPIGHEVTTVSATISNLKISTKITLEEDFDTELINDAITEVINEYLLELKKEWEDSNSLIVRIAHVESRILNVPGVIDISNTTINGLEDNVALSNDEIPYLSEVVLSE